MVKKMNNYRLLFNTIRRDKFQSRLLAVAFAAFVGFFIYITVFTLIDKSADVISYLTTTLRPLPFLVIFFMFFSFEFFYKSRALGEVFSTAENGKAKVCTTQLSVITTIVAVFSATALVFNLLSMVLCSQFDFYFILNMLATLILYFFFGCLAAAFMGAMLAQIRIKYISYMLMFLIALSGTALTNRFSFGIYNSFGVDATKFLKMLNLAPNSLEFAPNMHVGAIIEFDKAEQILFWLVLSVLVLALIQLKKPAQKAIAGAVCSVLCIALAVGYIMPMATPKMDHDSSSGDQDNNYYVIHNDSQKEEQANFKVKKYDLDFSFNRQLKCKATVYVDIKNLNEYKFTLYHNYKVSKVTNQNGNEMKFTQKNDYITVFNDAQTEYLCFEYSGGSPQYYSSYTGVLLPGNFAFYPVPGFSKTFHEDTSVGFLNVSLPYRTKFDVSVKALIKPYSNLNEVEENRFCGESNSLTLISGFLKTAQIGETQVVYPYLNKMYAPEKLERDLSDFVKANPQYKKIILLPNVNLTDYEGTVDCGDYLLTRQIFQLNEKIFDSKVCPEKRTLKSLLNEMLDNPNKDYINLTKQNGTDEEKQIIALLEELLTQEKKDENTQKIKAYLVDKNDKRDSIEFLNDLR